MDPSYIAEILIPADTLQARIAELGAEISKDYAGQDLLLLSVLKGSVLFIADLMRQITVPHAIDFMATSSYGGGQMSSGAVQILKDLDAPIEGRNVLVIEDIIDTGHTLDYLVRLLQVRRPKSLRICTLLNKPSRREVAVQVDYIGFDIPNKFVLGYGLDFNQLYRNLPYIAVLAPEYYVEA
ncbi:MAG: hypoxanthine phosphoribosyltransferase [Chloroflexi bacterium HGW-Chloroflexi-1]|nr:MAG: hypoxanthine phosphoribosyltransferase [Chloroflexi bacterium HGW-Chloroflexi-1]